MTTPESQSPPPQPSVPESKDRVYRSPAGLAGGVLLLALIAWLGIDAVVGGEGSTPWKALAAMLFLVPLVVAYTVRPAVFANEERLRVRNPFRVVTLPWDRVDSLRSGYSNEVFDEAGTKYQLWAIPVSLRARKKAARREDRRLAGDTRARGGRTGGGRGAGAAEVPDGPVRAESDRMMDELRELLESRELRAGAKGEKTDTAPGEVVVRWAYEVVVPAVAGAVLLGVLLGLG
ncbi:PH domain-containing protein [Streptomyces sp. NPDC004783]|uniref:PH domain-containing protein n=1 Tax=unclassified Streptomyces TaxID=2593676 RepID=UPI0033A13643